MSIELFLMEILFPGLSEIMLDAVRSCCTRFGECFGVKKQDNFMLRLLRNYSLYGSYRFQSLRPRKYREGKLISLMAFCGKVFFFNHIRFMHNVKDHTTIPHPSHARW